MRRRLWFVVAGVLAAAVLIDTGAWLWGTTRMLAELDRWKQAMAAQGWRVTGDEPVRRGWPFALALSIPALHISGGAGLIPGGLDWRADEATVSVDPFSPRTVEIRPGGTQLIAAFGAPATTVTAGSLVLTTRLAAAVPQRVDISGQDVAIVLPGQHGPVSLALLGGNVTLWPPPAAATPAFGFNLNAEAITLPAGRRYALGERIASAVLAGTVSGPAVTASDPAAAARAWRDGGGGVRIDRFSLGWGPLGLSGDATLRLDARLQPSGSGNVHVVGQEQTIDALAAARILTPGGALAARSFIGLLARPPAGGGEPVLDVPVTLEDRTLAIGKFPLFRLPDFATGPPG